MSIYYVIKVYREDPRSTPDYLGPRRDAGGDPPFPLGVCRREESTHFLWKDEALTALKTFMAEFGDGERVARGQVFHVTEVSWGPMVHAGAAPLEPASEPEEPVAPQNTTSWLDKGEAVLAAAEDCDLSDDGDHDAYQEATLWLYENAQELLAQARKCQRLDWLRMHPESCRALRDCRETRKPGFVFCAECCDQGVGGYFDVYQTHYSQKFTDILNKISSMVSTARPDSPRTGKSSNLL